MSLSTILALSTEFWFQIWISLEINIIIFIPLIFNKNNLSTNRIIKYFLTQAIARRLFILAILLSYLILWGPFFRNIITFVISIKLGLFPIYFWFPQVSEGLRWKRFLILVTWQKIIPLYVISLNNIIILNFIIVISAIIGCIIIYFQTSLRKLIAFSSLTHMSWILLSIQNYNNNWIIYFVVYSIIIISIFILMDRYNVSTLEENKLLFNFNQFFILTVTILSLGGLPPLLGFLPKWIIISNTKETITFFIFVLIISSLISIFIYIYIIYPLILNKTKKTKWHLLIYNKIAFFLNTIILIPLSPLIFF